jgi:hypothetical protein
VHEELTGKWYANSLCVMQASLELAVRISHRNHRNESHVRDQGHQHGVLVLAEECSLEQTELV